MKVAALVPFKCFTRAKKRLRSHYTDAQVEQLGRAMLADVLQALSGANGIGRVTVLTDDEAVAEVARTSNASVRLRDPDPGLNPAIEQGEEELAASGFDAALIVLGDLPLLRRADVEKVVAAGLESPVVLVPSSDGGTALLFVKPPLAIRPQFGPESAAAHERAAREAGLAPRILRELGEAVSLDLDTPEDARRVLASPRGSRTRALLEKYEP